jgi:hypothetical protein
MATLYVKRGDCAVINEKDNKYKAYEKYNNCGTCFLINSMNSKGELELVNPGSLVPSYSTVQIACPGCWQYIIHDCSSALVTRSQSYCILL